MEMMAWLKLVSFLCLICNGALTARILCVLPTPMKSHFMMFEPLILQLVKRGHDVTVLGPFPPKDPVKGLTHVDTSTAVPVTISSGNVAKRKKAFFVPYRLAEVFLSEIDETSKVFEIPEVRSLIESKVERFDLIFMELFSTDIGLAFMDRFKAPSIALSSCMILPWANSRFANPDNPSYIPQMFSEYTGRLTFLQRLSNSVHVLIYKFIFCALFTPRSQYYARKYFGEGVPRLEELGRNTSMLFVNSHISLYGGRPFVPAIVEVGGIHMQDAGKLPQELQTYLDESKHGVIYFCMGSMLKASTIPDDKRDALVEVFSKLKQNVLWKWEDDTLPGKPDNVKLVKWMPQRDVLAHPNVKLFISHGGLLGTTEAVYCGVPIIGIPFYGDQGVNIEAVASNGAGLRLDFHDINSETLYKAITEILNNPKYSENAKSLSERFRDRPLSPLETAVYWTEYVIRHKGAPHLRSAAVDLTWYQYLLLDVIAFILAILTSILLVFYYSIKFVIKRFRSSKKDAKEHQEQKVKKQTSQKPKVKKS